MPKDVSVSLSTLKYITSSIFVHFRPMTDSLFYLSPLLLKYESHPIYSSKHIEIIFSYSNFGEFIKKRTLRPIDIV